MNSKIDSWTDDIFWQEALEQYYELRNSGQSTITVDIEHLESFIFDGDSPAYKLMTAMRSVQELESHEGFCGAPRLVLALLAALRKLPSDKI